MQPLDGVKKQKEIDALTQEIALLEEEKVDLQRQIDERKQLRARLLEAARQESVRSSR